MKRGRVKEEQPTDELGFLRRRVSELEVAHRGDDRDLTESAERYRKVFEHSNDAIFIIDPAEDAILDANPRACELLGYSREEVLSIPVSAVHPNELPELQAFAASVLEQGYGRTNELTCSAKSGAVIDSEISASVVEMGGRVCLIAMVRDISERKRAEKALREMSVLEERNRLAREIHDSLAQGFTAIIWQVNAAERAVEGGGKQASQSLERVRDLARDGLAEARRSVWDLRAGPLGGRTLAEVLQQEMEKVTKGGDIQTSFNLSGEARVLPPGLEGAFLRICQESLANVLKHANATQVTVALAFGDSQIRLAIRDNGVGFDPATPRTRDRESGGFGLINMRERARVLGGELTAQSERGQGTLVEAILPLE